MADIATELNTIDHDHVGRHVKQAIHDALYKVNEDDSDISYDIAPECVTDIEPIEP
jgi:hypothetical protein